MNRKVKSIVLNAFGDLDQLEITNLPISSELKSQEVRVKVTYCGMNFSDIYTRMGFLDHLETPRILGSECVGTIVNVGLEVEDFKVGQRVVCFKWTCGLYREEVIVEQKYCHAVPNELSDQTVVCLPSQYLTAFFSLFDLGNLRPRQTVLIISCVGGLGCAAIQLCQMIGDVVIHGTTSLEKFEEAKSKGVHKVFRLEDLNKQSSRYDIVLDSLGGKYSEIIRSLLNPLGKSILIGANSVLGVKDPQPSTSIPPLDLVMNNIGVCGFHLGLVCEHVPSRVKQALEYLCSLCIEKKIKPCIHAVYYFDQYIQAQEEMMARKNVGKILLKPTVV